MANQEHLDILAKGVEVWNEWRKEHRDIAPHFSRAILHHADLRGVDLHAADLNDAYLYGAKLTNANLHSAGLRGASLNHAHLGDADLRNAYLRSADLTNATLRGADLGHANMHSVNLSQSDLNGARLYAANLSGANLQTADLRKANLRKTILSGADLTNANLWGAQMQTTNISGIDFRSVRGLESIRHCGPSAISIDTIYGSKGQIPEAFLRGAGVPENFIAYMRSLTGSAFEFYSCFISYSTQDQNFADRLHADLQARGVRCWFARHDIQGGRKIHDQIDEAIRVYDKLLLILSEHSMSSNWVKTEIANARAKEEQQKRQMLFPISLVPFDRVRSWKLFDAEAGIDSAREIREYFIPDFSRWKDHDSYSKVFERLIRDLKSGEKIAEPH